MDYPIDSTAYEGSFDTPSDVLEFKTKVREVAYLTADDLEHLPSTKWLVEDILPANAVTVLYGASDIGKSHLVLQMAVQVSENKSTGGGVVYFAGEGLDRGMRDKKVAICTYHQVDAGKLAFASSSKRIDLFDNAAIDQIIRDIRPLNPKLVIFDTLASCSGDADENSTPDMNRIVANCRRIQSETGAAILIVHHPTKDGRWMRGGSPLPNNADMILKVTLDDDKLIMSCDRSRLSAKFISRSFSPIRVDIGANETALVWIPSENAPQPDPRKLSKSQMAVLEVLGRAIPLAVGAKMRAISQMSEMPEKDIYNALNRLYELEYITLSKWGEPYYISEAGKAAFAAQVEEDRLAAATTNVHPKAAQNTAELVAMDDRSDEVSNQTIDALNVVCVDAITEIADDCSLENINESPISDVAESEPIKSTADTSNFEADHQTAQRNGARPNINLAEHDLLQKYAAFIRDKPDEFMSVQKVFPDQALDEQNLLYELHRKGYLEQNATNKQAYRLTDAGWSAVENDAGTTETQ